MNPRTQRPLSPRRLSLPLILVVATLAACASAPPSSAELPSTLIPAAWSTSGAGAGEGRATALANWWNRFNDPVLGDLVTRALQTSPSVQSAQAALRQARALRDVQQAGNGPSVGASGSAQRSQSGSAAGSNRFQAGFDASWEPDIFGGNRASLDASEAEARAAETSLADVQVSLAAEVAAGLIELRGLQARLDIAQRNLATQGDTLQITRWRVQAGLASSLDLEQAIAAHAQTQSQIPALQTSLTQSMNALSVLTGQAPGALRDTLSRVSPIPQAPAAIALSLPAETLRQRADVRTAEHRISAALSKVAAADAARYPSFKLGGSLGLSSLTLGALTDGASVVRSLLASVSVPLFDGGAARAQVQAQEAALEQARASYASTVLTALKDVEDALVAIQGDQERLTRLQTAATAAVNAELLARQRYQSGLIDFRTVLDTQRSLLSAQDSLASLQATLATDHVRLYKALGGGWTPDAPASSTATR
ncbi:efflux transporter outer membrane subunit [Hydrogenophaga sp. MI9]|uniref:efflux transporter outer membrane subunit n=1 Tax=Hydrogenophaga sp. MI9 TaxID=3453719 RepID=UPI003EEADA6D